ncbi:MAG: hypothetical protein VW233_05710, partial [Paracoccaceae bacterium]
MPDDTTDGHKSPTPKCPIWIQKLTICPKVALAGPWWIFCAAKYAQNGAGRSIPYASIFQKNNTAPKNLYFALKFVASLGEYYSYKPHNWLFSVTDFRPYLSDIESNCGCQ